MGLGSGEEKRSEGGGGGVFRVGVGEDGVFLSRCALNCLPTVSPASGMNRASANTELCKADQLHLVGDLRVFAAGNLRQGGEMERVNGGGPPAC